ncbi:hypothetical protein JCM8097_007093 [Rhodosporidiobolus ruineniae]
MPAVTLDTLPEDVLDLIFRFIEDDFDEADGQARLSTFNGLCLVCRALLPVGRAYLYVDPLVSEDRTWERALSLSSSLEATECALGRFVHNWTFLPRWSHALAQAEAPASLPFQIRTHSKAYSWFLAVLSICPNLTAVGIAFRTSAQLASTLEALSPSLPTLTSVRLGHSNGSPITEDVVHEFSNAFPLDRIEQFEVVSLTSMWVSAKPMNPLRIQAMTIELDHTALTIIIQILPEQTHFLRSLVVRGIAGLETPKSHVVDVVELVGSVLTNLTLDFIPSAIEHGVLTVPLAFFGLLPEIRHLQISNAQALSVDRVKLLCSSSPHLTVLLCIDCIWCEDDHSPALLDVEGWQARLFRVPELVAAFSQLEHLEGVILGNVPHSAATVLEPLNKALRDRGVAVGGKYESC